jgi:hypothetical protein
MKIELSNVRLAFPDVDELGEEISGYAQGDFKFRAMLLVSKERVDLINQIRTTINSINGIDNTFA